MHFFPSRKSFSQIPQKLAICGRIELVMKLKYYQKNLIILSLTNFLAASSWNQVIPFMPQFLRELGAGAQLATWSGLVFALHYLSGIFMQPFWGKAADRYGRKPMVIRAGFCLAFVYFGMSLCQAPWQLATMRFLNGALTGFVPGAVTLIATNTPGALAGRYVAIAQSANALGNVLGPAIGGFLALKYSYRSSMRLSGISVLLATLLVIFLVEEREKVTLNTDTSFKEDLTIAWQQPPLLTSLYLVFLGTMLSVAVQPLLTLFLETLNPTKAPWLLGLVFSLPGLAFVLAAYPWNRLGERVSYRRVALWGLIGAACFLALSAIAKTISSFSFLYLCYGLFLAAVTPAASSIIAQDVPEEFRGRAYGLQQAATNLGGLIAPLLAGAMANLLGLSAAFWGTGVLVLSLAACFYLRVETGSSSCSKPGKSSL